MKKWISIVFIFTILFGVTACGNAAGSEMQEERHDLETARSEEMQESTQEIESLDDKTQQENNMDTNILVVYFSCTGTTKALAEYAAEALNADIWEIVAEQPYTNEDLAYYTDCRADREQNDSAARPAISGSIENMEQYDTIIIGYPIWHGQAPRIISTFLESYNFAGKTVVPFCTSHSSGIGSSDINLHELCDSTVIWKDGKRFGAGTTKDEMAAWLQSSGIESVIMMDSDNGTVEPVFDFETKTVMLNSGYDMPINGIGTYNLLDDVCVTSVSEALNCGVRLIDTAYMYHNDVICCEL